MDFLFLSSDDESNPDICQIWIADGGSQLYHIKASIQGVLVYGIINNGADTTISVLQQLQTQKL